MISLIKATWSSLEARRLTGRLRSSSALLLLMFLGPLRPTFGDELLLTSGITGPFPLIREDLITTQTLPSLSRDATYQFSFGNQSSNSLLAGSFDASGTATYGTLRFKVSASQGGQQNSPVITEFSSALWSDAITFQTLSAGYFILNFHLKGSLSSFPPNANDGTTHANGLIRFSGGLTSTGFTDYRLSDSDPSMETLDTIYSSAAIPFVPGTPVTVFGSGGANITLACGPNPFGFCNSWSDSGSLNFGDTIALTGIEVFDTNNTPVQNFTITSQSGTVYTANGVVPEPSYLFLLGGLAILMLFQRRRSLS